MTRRSLVILILLVAMLVPATGSFAQSDEFVFGMILVGPRNDHGWSEAHYTAGQYVEANVPGTRMVAFESLNAADAPETTLEQVVDDMVNVEGAKLILTTSDEFEEDTTAVAALYPDVTFVNISGDDVLAGDAPANLSNIMGAMVWGKQIAGCAAALTTQTGSIGYLGPLINAETRRLASSVYLGARYCYENYRGMNPADLTFTVTWIGFWFNIPGFTLDPTEQTNLFFDQGADVVVSGIDTPEALVEAGKRVEQGESVWAVPYDYADACAQAPNACLGVPYFNWGPAYVNLVQAVMDGTWEQTWTWNAPYWADLTDNDQTAVGWVNGEALTEDQANQLDSFVEMLAESGTGDITAANIDDEGLSLGLWVGPLNLQDGTELAADGDVVPPRSVWYLEQLLEGMTGDSSAQ